MQSEPTEGSGEGADRLIFPQPKLPAMTKLDVLVRASQRRKNDPIRDLPWDQPPSVEMRWMSEPLLSLCDQDEFAAISEAQRIELSQLEFCLFCSVAACGEKEVVANVAKRMLKQRYARYRPYFYHFVTEENNHIHMFAEFCARFGTFYPILYSYASGPVLATPELEDLFAFAQIVIFEDLVQGMNEFMMNDASLPPLVRAINRYHVEDEGRHIAFGHLLLTELATELRDTSPPSEWAALQEAVARYVHTRHIDYHNLSVYRKIGLPDAFNVRDRMVTGRNASYFARIDRGAKRVSSLFRLLRELHLLGPSALTN